MSGEEEKLKKARIARDQLLAQDEEQNAKVIQDTSEDYTQLESNVWLTPSQRAQAKKTQLEYEKKVVEEKRVRRVDFDFTTGLIANSEKVEVAQRTNFLSPFPLSFLNFFAKIHKNAPNKNTIKAIVFDFIV